MKIERTDVESEGEYKSETEMNEINQDRTIVSGGDLRKLKNKVMRLNDDLK